jgi:hypothetical protein
VILTQERIDEIALECWNYYLSNISLFTISDMFQHFLSRIREEQEAVAYVVDLPDESYVCFPNEMHEYIESHRKTPLFTIPPAAPECNCNELVAEYKEDAERYRWLRAQHWTDNTIGAVRNPKEAIKLGYDAPSEVRLDEFIDEAIAKHKAMMELQNATSGNDE